MQACRGMIRMRRRSLQMERPPRQHSPSVVGFADNAFYRFQNPHAKRPSFHHSTTAKRSPLSRDIMLPRGRDTLRCCGDGNRSGGLSESPRWI